MENTIQILASAGPAKATKSLWLATLRTLRNSFEHDQDGMSHSLRSLNNVQC